MCECEGTTAPSRRHHNQLHVEMAATAAAAGGEPAAYGARKPVKPDDDLVAYIRQLDLPLEAAVRASAAAAATPTAGGQAGDDTPALLTGLFREIRKREAAVVTHKATAYVVERAVRLATAHTVTRFLLRVTPYAAFVAANRFGSHVLQTALARAHALLMDAGGGGGDAGEDGDADDGDDGSDLADAEWRALAGSVALPSALVEAAGATGARAATSRSKRLALVAAVCGVAAAVMANVSELVFDVSGTHVLRSVAATLAGRAPPTYRHTSTHDNADDGAEHRNDKRAAAGDGGSATGPLTSGHGWCSHTGTGLSSPVVMGSAGATPR